MTSCCQKCYHCIMKDKDFLWFNLRTLPYFRAMLRAVEAQFYQEFDLPSPTLDLGCGDGHFASIAFERPLEAGWTHGLSRFTRQPKVMVIACWFRRMAAGFLSRTGILPARLATRCWSTSLTSGRAGRVEAGAEAWGTVPVLRAQPAIPE